MIFRRLLGAIPNIIGVVVVTFLLTRALPGDPAAFYAGQAATKEAVEEIRKSLGLDKTMLQQFGYYVRDLAQGELGNSLSTGQPVIRELATRLPASLELTLSGLLFAAVVALPLGHAIGRVGCFINGCCYGLHCDLPWAVRFPADHESHGVPVHPTQLYEAGYNFLLFGGLLAYFLRRRPAAGRVFALYLLLYPPFRFLVESIREEPHGAGGLTAAQQTSIPLFLIGLVLWFYFGRMAPGVEQKATK